MRGEVSIPPFTGMYLPDTSAETPPGSLALATDCVVSDAGGALQRMGRTMTATNHSSVAYCFVHMESGTPQFVVLDSSGNYQLYSAGSTSLNAGSSGSTGQAAASGHCQMLRSPLTATDPDTYVCSKTATLKRWDGSAWSAIANSPKAGAICQAGFSDRMVATAFTANATNGPNAQPVTGSTVYVSNASAPETWTTGDYTELTPGDGEDILDCCTFANQTIVFKNTRFFVIYGENASGGAVDLLFHERSGVGLAVKGAWAVSPIGVFFLARDGIYLTDGGPAVKVSGDIDGLFTGNLPAWTTLSRFLPPPVNNLPKFALSGDFLYCAVDNVTSGGTVRCNTIAVYNWRRKSWTLWDQEAAALATMPWGTSQAVPVLIGIGYNGTNYRAATWHPTVYTDDGSYIPMTVQTNWFRAEQGQGSVGLDQAMIMRLEAWGKGKATAGVCVDYEPNPAATKTIDFEEMAIPPQWNSVNWNEFEWPNQTYSSTDLLRLSAPSREYAANLNGRGNYLSVRFSKVSTSTFFYVERPKMTLQGR